MKIINIILLSLVLSSCNFIMIDGRIVNLNNIKNKERITRIKSNDSTQIVIRNEKNSLDLLSKDSLFKNKIEFIYFNLDYPYTVTDIINEFPNLSEIFLSWGCTGINVNKTPINLKSIIITSTDKKIKNLTSFKNIERIVFTDPFHNDNYYSGLLKEFPKLKDLTLDIPSEYFSIPKNVIALDNLEKLTITRTSMKKVPRVICKMKGLKELTIESDRFLKVPDCIFKMDSLRIITVIGTDKDVAKFYEKYKDKNPKIQIKTIGGNNYY